MKNKIDMADFRCPYCKKRFGCNCFPAICPHCGKEARENEQREIQRILFKGVAYGL